MALFKKQKEEYVAPSQFKEEFVSDAAVKPEEVFSEPAKEVVPEPPKPVAPPKKRTVISEGTTFIGNIATNDPIEINGCVKGDISSTTGVVITEHGKYEGNASVQDMTVKGLARGFASVVHNTLVESSGSFEGNLISANLLTKEGAIIEGNIKLGAKKAPAVEEYVSPVEAAAEQTPAAEPVLEATEETGSSAAEESFTFSAPGFVYGNDGKNA